MPTQQDLTLAVLFKAVEDGTFRRVVRRLTTLLQGLNQTLGNTSSASKKLQKDIDKLNKKLKQLGKDGQNTGKQIGNVSGAVKRLGAALKVTSSYFLTGTFFYGLIQGAAEGVKEIVNFDQALRNLAAISGGTSADIAAMKDVIIDTAQRTKYSTTEIAEGMVLLSQAGLDAGEAVNAIGAVADLAAGTLTDLKSTSDLVTTSLRAFNIEAEETRRVADVMANAVNKSKLTVDKLRIAFNYIGAGAHQAGLSIEQTAASMMMLANAGARASTIGTGLRQVMSRLLSPNAKLREAMESYGLQIDKADGSTAWFEKQVGKLANVMWDAEKQTVNMSKAYELFGLRGAQAAAILIDSYMDVNGTWNRTLDLAHRVGTAQSMMEEQAKGLAFKIKNLSDILRTFAIGLGDAGFTQVLRVAVDLLRTFAQALTDAMGTAVGKAIANTILLTAALHGLVGVISLIKYLLPTLVKLKAFFVAGAGISGFLGVAAVAAAFGTMFAYLSHLKSIGEETEKLIVKNGALTKSITHYRDKLAQAEEGSKEYYIIVDRLKQAHPELADEIDKVSNSYEKLDHVLEQVAQQARETEMRNTVERLQQIQGTLSVIMSDYKRLGGEEALGKSLKEYAKDSDFVQNLFGSWANAMESADVVAQSLAADLVRLHKAGMKIEDPLKELQTIYDYFRKDGEKIDSKVWDFITEETIRLFDKELDYMARQLERNQRELATILDRLPAKWKEVYHSLDDIEKAHFLKAIESAKNGWAGIKKIFETYKDVLYKGNEQLYLKDLKEVEEAYWKESLQRWYMNTAKRKAVMENEFLPAWQKIYDKLDWLDRVRFAKAYRRAMKEWARTEELIKKQAGFELLAEEQKNAALLEARQKFLDEYLRRWLITEEKKRAQTQKIWDRINKYAAKSDTDRYRAGAEKARVWLNETIRKIDADIYASHVQKLKMMLAAQEAYFAQLEQLYKDHGKPEDKELLEHTTGRKAPPLGGVGNVDELLNSYRTGQHPGATIDDYQKRLEEFYTQGKIDAEEYRRVLERTFSAPGDAFANGWKQAMDEVKSGSEFLYDLGNQLPEQLADGFANAWGEFLDGTKSAGEAFKDFAIDTLRWISEMMIKWAMLKAMQSMGFGVAHGGSIVGRDSAMRSQRVLPAFVADIAPRLHNGINNKLKPNEYPAILEKDEGVFTKEQMKALGKRNGMSINIPITVGDQQGADMFRRHVGPEVEETVLRVMRRYMQ